MRFQEYLCQRNLEKNGEYFGLKVKGDSMIEAGINEGDTVIIKKNRYS